MTSNDIFLGGGSNSGSLINANLPNIKAEWALLDDDAWNNRSSIYNSMFNISAYYGTDNQGAFRPIRRSTEEAIITYGCNSAYSYGLNAGRIAYPVTNHLGNVASIDASRYNSTYNNSNRVNPNYYVIEFWIKFK